MIALNEPIGSFVALAKIEKGFLPEKSIEQDISNLIDLITVRIKEQSVEDVASGLLRNIFDIRFDLVEWLSLHDKNLLSYRKSLAKHISVNLEMAPYSALAKCVSDVLRAYAKIASPLIEALPVSLEGIHSGKIQYDTFDYLALHPSPQIRSLKTWIDSSLKLEVGIILADLILTDQVQLAKSRIKSELTEFLYNQITRFGAYSIFTGYWSPDPKDISPLTNSMQILSATFELDAKSVFQTNSEGLINMIDN